MNSPQDFLRVSVTKNQQSKFLENPKYIESGKVISMQVISFKENEVRLQLQLSNPLYVSLDPLQPDRLTVDVLDPSCFVSAWDFQTTVLKDTSLSIQLDQRLVPEELQQTMNSINSKAEKANLLATSSLPINLALGVSLKYLWGMVNSLQFVVYMKEWKVNWPPNAKLVVATIETIALGKFIDKDKLMQNVMHFYGLPVSFKSASQARELSVAPTVNIKRIAFSAAGIAGLLMLAVVSGLLIWRSKYRQKLVQQAKEIK